jgi:hypothetical protein
MFEITPYIWAASLDADVTVRGRNADIDTDPEDTFDALKIGGSLLSALQYGSLVVYAQGDFLELDSDELDNAPTRGDLEVDTTIATLGLGYQFPGWSDRQTFDVLLGARYFKVQSELTLDRSGTFRGDQDYLDPVLIVRPSIRISDRWRFNPTLSYGTGGDSEESYELWPQVQFDINDNIALRFGYRKLHYEVESGRRGNAFDGAFEGGMLGLGGKFGYRAKPVAQLAPEPPPPPKDTDRDGIARGFGETQPASNNGTAAGRAENRRVMLRRTDAI